MERGVPGSRSEAGFALFNALTLAAVGRMEDIVRQLGSNALVALTGTQLGAYGDALRTYSFPRHLGISAGYGSGPLCSCHSGV